MGHFGRLNLPVALFKGILDDTKGVNPDILISQFHRDIKSILESLGELLYGNISAKLSNIRVCERKEFCWAPAMAQSKVLCVFGQNIDGRFAESS